MSPEHIARWLHQERECTVLTRAQRAARDKAAAKWTGDGCREQRGWTAGLFERRAEHQYSVSVRASSSIRNTQYKSLHCILDLAGPAINRVYVALLRVGLYSHFSTRFGRPCFLCIFLSSSPHTIHPFPFGFLRFSLGLGVTLSSPERTCASPMARCNTIFVTTISHTSRLRFSIG